MSTQMHFRKRQLLEYEVETNLKLLAQQQNEVYPSSFQSTPSPVKYVTEPKNVNIPTEHTPEKSTQTITDYLQLKPCSEYNEFAPLNLAASSVASTLPMKDEAEAWLDITTKLMQDIETKLMQQKKTESSFDTKPSAILLDKLSILKGKCIRKSKQTKKSSSPKPKLPTKNLKAKRINKIKKTVVLDHATSPYVKGKLDTKRLYDIIGIDPSWLKEKKEIVGKHEVVVKNEVQEEPILPVEIKSEMTDELPHSSFKIPDSNQQVEATSKTHSPQRELGHIGDRIKRILAEQNRLQQRMGTFAKSGIHVYEQVHSDYTQAADDILIRSNDNSRIYKYTPPTKKPFVHITADTLPEELDHLTTVADIVNPLQQKHDILTPLQKFPYTSLDNERQLIIGPNGTQMSIIAWCDIDWNLSAPAVTRKVLMGVFDRNTLATHSLTGRPSPAFMNLNKPEKLPLDVNKVADIVSLVTSRINVTHKEVRMAITSKCADECKIVKIRKQKAIYSKENTRIEPYYMPVNVPKVQY